MEPELREQEEEQNQLDSEPQQAHQLTQEKQTRTQPRDSNNFGLQEQHMTVGVAVAGNGSHFGVTGRVGTGIAAEERTAAAAG